MYIEQLAQLIGTAAASQPQSNKRITVGVYSGGQIQANGAWYHPIWAGDFDAVEGQFCDCVVEGNKCVVLSVYG